MEHSLKLKAKVVLWPGMAAWHFAVIPKKQSALIRNRFEGMKRGFGSLPVTVQIGETTWKTSIFPDTKIGSYLLPLKASVRKKEHIEAGKSVSITISIRI